MYNEPIHHVVALCGPPGSGKSAIADRLLQSLPSVTRLDMDDYQSFTDIPVEQIMAWIDSGADSNQFDIPLLDEHLAALSRGQAIHHPRSGPMEPADIILFESHFGRRHQATGQYIDRLIWLDIPLDLALARKISSFCAEFQQAPDYCAEQVAWLDSYLQGYQHMVHHALMLQQGMRETADLIIDASQPADSVCEQILQAIREFQA